MQVTQRFYTTGHKKSVGKRKIEFNFYISCWCVPTAERKLCNYYNGYLLKWCAVATCIKQKIVTIFYRLPQTTHAFTGKIIK